MHMRHVRFNFQNDFNLGHDFERSAADKTAFERGQRNSDLFGHSHQLRGPLPTKNYPEECSSCGRCAPRDWYYVTAAKKQPPGKSIDSFDFPPPANCYN